MSLVAHHVDSKGLQGYIHKNMAARSKTVDVIRLIFQYPFYG